MVPLSGLEPAASAQVHAHIELLCERLQSPVAVAMQVDCAFCHAIRDSLADEKATLFLSHLAEQLSERLIGSIRRECLDHVVVFWEGASAPCAAPLRGTHSHRQPAFRKSLR